MTKPRVDDRPQGQCRYCGRPYVGTRTMCREAPDSVLYHQAVRKPQGGDAVRLAAPWPWAGDMVKVGDIGVLQGPAGRDVDGGSIMFHHSTFRDEGTVSSSGGPGTIWTEATALRPTDERVTLKVWKWKDGWARAHNGAGYEIEVPVWDWYPKERD